MPTASVQMSANHAGNAWLTAKPTTMSCANERFDATDRSNSPTIRGIIAAKASSTSTVSRSRMALKLLMVAKLSGRSTEKRTNSATSRRGMA